jgi:hypothetical protein
LALIVPWFTKVSAFPPMLPAPEIVLFTFRSSAWLLLACTVLLALFESTMEPPPDSVVTGLKIEIAVPLAPALSSIVPALLIAPPRKRVLLLAAATVLPATMLTGAPGPVPSSSPKVPATMLTTPVPTVVIVPP